MVPAPERCYELNTDAAISINYGLTNDKKTLTV